MNATPHGTLNCCPVASEQFEYLIPKTCSKCDANHDGVTFSPGYPSCICNFCAIGGSMECSFGQQMRPACQLQNCNGSRHLACLDTSCSNNQIETLKSQHCGACGDEGACTLFCYSCGAFVCSICMVEEEACCIPCLEAFPTFLRRNASAKPDCIEWIVPSTVSQDSISTRLSLHSKHDRTDHFNDTVCLDDARKHPGDVSAAGSEKGFAFEPTCIDEDGTEAATTIMIRNIPCRLGQGDILEAIHSAGFADTYDFLYLPNTSRKKTRGNAGYAFVNFNTAQLAERFISVFENWRFARTNSSKQCTLTYAHWQGFNAMNAAASHQHKASLSLHS